MAQMILGFRNWHMRGEEKVKETIHRWDAITFIASTAKSKGIDRKPAA